MLPKLLQQVKPLVIQPASPHKRCHFYNFLIGLGHDSQWIWEVSNKKRRNAMDLKPFFSTPSVIMPFRVVGLDTHLFTLPQIHGSPPHLIFFIWDSKIYKYQILSLKQNLTVVFLARWWCRSTTIIIYRQMSDKYARNRSSLMGGGYVSVLHHQVESVACSNS